MKFNEVAGSTINPVADVKIAITLAQIEDYIITELVKIDPKSASEFDNFSIRCKNLILKDILQLIKSKIISLNNDPELIGVINNIFDAIDLQFSILEEVVKNKISNKDLLIILSAMFVAYFKKI